MLSLFALLVIPIIFISFILLVSIIPNNLNSNWNVNNNLSLVIYQGKFNRTFWSNIWNNNIIINNKDHKEYKYSIYKRLGMVLSLILYFLIIIYWLKYNRTTINYQLLTVPGNDHIWNLDISLGLDGISLPFVLLVGFIMPLVFLSNWSTIDSLDIYYVIIIILLELFLIIVFLVLDLIMFYVFFESTLPLLFILIGLYGSTQKFRAAFYIFLYTLINSLGNFLFQCTRTKFRGTPKALITKIIKETFLLAPVMNGGMVISLKMKVMKWDIADLNQIYSVKEQRVDGSLTLYFFVIRCTLVAGKTGS
jgi:Proton-conducting membrane transporter